MAGALDMLGAGDGLRSQYIVVKVNHVDGPVFKKFLEDNNVSGSGAIAPLVLMATDTLPKAVIDVGLPVAAQQLERLGIHATLTASDAPPAQGVRKTSEFFPGAILGASVVSVVIGVGWGAWKLLFGRVFA